MGNKLHSSNPLPGTSAEAAAAAIFWNPDETTTKFSTLKKTQPLRFQNVFKLHYIARKLARIYWTSNFQMTQKKPQQQQHHITYILGSVLIIVSRMSASAEVRNSTILRGGRGKKKKRTTTTSDLRREKKGGKQMKMKKLWKFSSSAGVYDRLIVVAAAAAAALEPWPRTAATAQEILQLHAILLLAPSGYSLTSCNQQASSLWRMKRKIEL